MLAAAVFVLAGVASYFVPAPMYGDAFVCAWNVNHGAPVDIIVVNDDNGNEINCRVIGSGPFVDNRVLDVSVSAAKALGFYDAGTANVRIYEPISSPPNRNCDCESCGLLLSFPFGESC